MRKKLLLLTTAFLLSFAIGTITFSQNIVKIGNSLISTDNMEKSKSILVKGGMVIEPVEELLGIDPDLRITVSNGSNAQSPILCTVEAMSKYDRRISIVTFVYNGNANNLEPQLRNLGYKFVDEGEYREYIHTFSYKRYKHNNKVCRISRPTNGERGAMLEFVLIRGER